MGSFFKVSHRNPICIPVLCPLRPTSNISRRVTIMKLLTVQVVFFPQRMESLRQNYSSVHFNIYGSSEQARRQRHRGTSCGLMCCLFCAQVRCHLSRPTYCVSSNTLLPRSHTVPPADIRIHRIRHVSSGHRGGNLYYLVICGAMWSGRSLPTFRRNVMPPCPQ
jgi:hypothetical protein